ncbi:hypothetical protein L208DRAFT_1412011 [Tricholoma matsutake]|nr:hypothetical protein L208DRAFT_1412011 [Tricholoma matsutake 945]
MYILNDTLGQPKACLPRQKSPESMDWDDEYDLLVAGGGNAGPSLLETLLPMMTI